MCKRFMMGMLLLSLAAIWVSEAFALNIWCRRSVAVTVTGDQDDDGDTFVTGIFGLPADEGGNCGDVLGKVYCANSSTFEARLACLQSTGYSAALVVAIDKDTISAGAPYIRDGATRYFAQEEVNFDIKDFGQREQLRVFEEWAVSENPVVKLNTGDSTSAVGLHLISDGSFNLRNYIGFWDESLGKFIPASGYGIDGEKEISKVDLEALVGGRLDDLVGQTVCGVVHHDEIKGDTLKGNYLGTVAFYVSGLTEDRKMIEVEVLDADEICGLELYNEPTDAGPSAENNCKTFTDVAFAPARPDGSIVEGEGKFAAGKGTIACNGVCKDTVTLELDDGAGQDLCDKKYPNEGTDFVKFIPVNRGGSGVYAKYAFTGRVESDNDELDDMVICGENVSSSSGVIYFSRYGCVPIESVSDPYDDPTTIPSCEVCEQAPWPFVPSEE